MVAWGRGLWDEDVGGAHPGGEAGLEGMAAYAVVSLAEYVDAVVGVLQGGCRRWGRRAGRPAGLFQAWTRWTYWPLQ